MGYSQELRKNLLHTEVKKKCCAGAELSALLKFSHDNKRMLDNDDVNGRIAYLKKKCGTAVSEMNECCESAILKAAFELSGSVSSPEAKNPYVEISFAEEGEAKEISELLHKNGINSGVSKRREKFVCYVKNSEGISSFLAIIGLSGEAIKFFVAKTDREVANDANRKFNCDMANIKRSVSKHEAEIGHIEKLRKSGKLEDLPQDLYQLAILRENNPEATYSELAELSRPPCSKATISNRMKLILQK